MFRKRPTSMFPESDPKELERIMNEPGPFDPPAPIGLVDGRCFCSRCEERTKDIYRMIGSCFNCKATPILMLYRSGDPAAILDCPLCGNYKTVHPSRRAPDDEIPAAVVGRDTNAAEGSGD